MKIFLIARLLNFKLIFSIIVYTFISKNCFAHKNVKLLFEVKDSSEWLTIGQHNFNKVTIKDTIFFNIANKIAEKELKISPGVIKLSTSDSLAYDIFIPDSTAEELVFKIVLQNSIMVNATCSFSETYQNLFIISNNINYTKVDSCYQQYKNTLLGTACKAYLPFENNLTKPAPGSKEEIILQMNAHRNAYLNNIDFSIDYIENIPVVYEKVNHYFNQLVSKDTSALKNAINYLLVEKQPNDTFKEQLELYLFHYLFTRKRDMIFEHAYYYLAANYIKNSTSSWVTEKVRIQVKNDLQFGSRTKFGIIPPKISMPDVNGKLQFLHKVKADYTIIYFYDYDCHTCEQVTPKLRKLYYSNKKKNLKVFAVCLGETSDKWKEYVVKNKLNEWVNVFDFSTHKVTPLVYSLKYTPTLFLLDKDKRIILKNVSLKEYESFFKKL